MLRESRAACFCSQNRFNAITESPRGTTPARRDSCADVLRLKRGYTLTVFREGTTGMRTIWFVATAVAAASVVLAADWRSDLARKTIGSAVREGLEDAAKDAALDAALDVAADAVSPSVRNYATSRFRDIDDHIEFATEVGDGVETAMRVADVAETLDDVADAARVAKNIGKLRKLKR